MHEKRVIPREHKSLPSDGRHAVGSGRLTSHVLQSVAEIEKLRASGKHSPSRDWRWSAYQQIRQHATHADFPCFFAAKAFESEAPVFLFADSAKQIESRAAIAGALTEYLGMVSQRSGWEAASAVLFIVFKPQRPARPLVTYHEQAWEILGYLHHHDPKAWPRDIPTEIDDPDWSFCFDGVPMFVNISCPAHTSRRSRNLGESLTLVMQPRAAFDEIAGNTPAGHQVRRRIRARIQKYDLIGPSPALGAYGDRKNREWAQYGLEEQNTEIPTTCPYKNAFKKK